MKRLETKLVAARSAVALAEIAVQEAYFVQDLASYARILAAEAEDL